MNVERLELVKDKDLLQKSDQTASSKLIGDTWSRFAESKEAIAVPVLIAGAALLPRLMRHGISLVTALGEKTPNLVSRVSDQGLIGAVAAKNESSLSLAHRLDLHRPIPDYVKSPEHLASRAPVDRELNDSVLPRGQSMVRFVNVDGEHRSYMLHIPKSVDPEKGAPLVVAMEGFLAGTNQPWHGMAETNGINAQAEKLGFIALYPVPKPRLRDNVFTWNEPDGATNFLGARPYSDNKYIQAAMDSVMNDFPVDKSRIYGIGFSQGAMQLHHLVNASEPGTFKAIAAVAGTLTEKFPLPPSGTRLLVMHSESDPTLPYSGGTGFLPAFADRMGWGFARNSRPHLQVPNYLRANEIAHLSPETLTMPEYSVKTWLKDGHDLPTVQEVMFSSKYGHTFPGRLTKDRETLFTIINGPVPPPAILDAKRWITEDFFGLGKVNV